MQGTTPLRRRRARSRSKGRMRVRSSTRNRALCKFVTCICRSPLACRQDAFPFTIICVCCEFNHYPIISNITHVQMRPADEDSYDHDMGTSEYASSHARDGHMGYHVGGGGIGREGPSGWDEGTGFLDSSGQIGIQERRRTGVLATFDTASRSRAPVVEGAGPREGYSMH